MEKIRTKWMESYEALFDCIQRENVDGFKEALLVLGSSSLWKELVVIPAILNVLRKKQPSDKKQFWREKRLEMLDLILEYPHPEENDRIQNANHFLKLALTAHMPEAGEKLARAGYVVQYLEKETQSVCHDALCMGKWWSPELILMPEVWDNHWASLAIASLVYKDDLACVQQTIDRILTLHPLTAQSFSEKWMGLARVGLTGLLSSPDPDKILKALNQRDLIDFDFLQEHIDNKKLLVSEENKVKLKSVLDRYVLLDPSSSSFEKKIMRPRL